MSQDKMIPGPASFSNSNISTYFFKEEKQKERVVSTPLGLHSLTCMMAAMSHGPEWVTHREGYYAPGSSPSCEDPQCSCQAAHPAPVRGALPGEQVSLSFTILPGLSPSVPRSSSGTTEPESSPRGSCPQGTPPAPHQLQGMSPQARIPSWWLCFFTVCP